MPAWHPLEFDEWLLGGSSSHISHAASSSEPTYSILDELYVVPPIRTAFRSRATEFLQVPGSGNDAAACSRSAEGSSIAAFNTAAQASIAQPVRITARGLRPQYTDFLQSTGNSENQSSSSRRHPSTSAYPGDGGSVASSNLMNDFLSGPRSRKIDEKARFTSFEKKRSKKELEKAAIYNERMSSGPRYGMWYHKVGPEGYTVPQLLPLSSWAKPELKAQRQQVNPLWGDVANFNRKLAMEAMTGGGESGPLAKVFGPSKKEKKNPSKLSRMIMSAIYQVKNAITPGERIRGTFHILKQFVVRATGKIVKFVKMIVVAVIAKLVPNMRMKAFLKPEDKLWIKARMLYPPNGQVLVNLPQPGKPGYKFPTPEAMLQARDEDPRPALMILQNAVTWARRSARATAEAQAAAGYSEYWDNQAQDASKKAAKYFNALSGRLAGAGKPDGEAVLPVLRNRPGKPPPKDLKKWMEFLLNKQKMKKWTKDVFKKGGAKPMQA